MEKKILTVLTAACLSACLPAPVDPNITYSITGQALNVDGAPATNALITLYRIDSWIGVEKNFLQYPNFEDGLQYARQYKSITDNTGHFQFTVPGYEANTSRGNSAAFFMVVLGPPDGGTAITASDTFFFSATTPHIWIPSLKLWRGPISQPKGENFELSWRGSLGPAGTNTYSSGQTSVFLYAANQNRLQSAYQRYQESTVIPRAIFDNTWDPAEYFATCSAHIGSQKYSYRSALRSVEAEAWQPAMARINHLTHPSAKFYDLQFSETYFDALMDGNPNSSEFLEQGPLNHQEGFLMDLGSPRVINEILIYNINLQNFADTAITVSISKEDTDYPVQWKELSRHYGQHEFEDWLYLAHTTQAYGRWLKLEATRSSNSYPSPLFRSIGEIRILE